MPDTQSEPFGNPEGARADLDEFVAYEGEVRFAGLATRANDLTARVFVGRKGAGKTIYLRRQQASAADEPSLFADEVQADFPATHSVVEFTESFAPSEQVEAWAALWKRAITRSVVAHITSQPRLRSLLEEDDALAYKSDYSQLLPSFRTPMSIYSQAGELLRYGSFRSRRYQYHIANSAWDELEYRLGITLGSLPPVCFYIDSLDEVFHEAPGPWLKCQQGLLNQVMRFLRDARLGGRLHVTVGVRDIVYSAALRTEHATRFRNEPHIRILEWGTDAIRHLLYQKIERLPKECLLRPTADTPLIRFLGKALVENLAFNTTEPLDQYLLRHTRLIPRDVIQLGNDLTRDVAIAKAEGRRELSDETIRHAVHRAARSFGDEQLLICANQIVADSSGASTGGRHRGTEPYYANPDYQRGIDGKVRDLVRSNLQDRFDSSALERFQDAGRAEFGEGIDLASILWQNGLLGYASTALDDGGVILHSAATGERFLVPRRKQMFLLHPCMLDAVDGIRSTGTQPIHPARSY